MKLLSIMRHAKSSWEYTDLEDIERPLLNKGIRRTQRVCQYMKMYAIIPDSIISSPATRAIETAGIVIDELSLSLQPQLRENFYPGLLSQLVSDIAATANEINHLMVFGHNPGFSDLANTLANNFNVDWLPTSGLVTIEFETDNWMDIINMKGRCVHYIAPKQLKNS